MTLRPALNESRLAVTGLVVGVALALSVAPTSVAPQTSSVRLAMVNVPDDVLRPLLPDFQKQTGRSATIVYTGNNPFAVAREGNADLVISHYGHEGVEPFVTDGVGLWPHPVFANQMALLGPPSDPAHVGGLANATEALRRIAATKSRFLVNNSAGAKYLEEIFWTGAGVHEKGDWYSTSSRRTAGRSRRQRERCLCPVGSAPVPPTQAASRAPPRAARGWRLDPSTDHGVHCREPKESTGR
jgi:tungstate transport system substrate-binding protein